MRRPKPRRRWRKCSPISQGCSRKPRRREQEEESAARTRVVRGAARVPSLERGRAQGEGAELEPAQADQEPSVEERALESAGARVDPRDVRADARAIGATQG